MILASTQLFAEKIKFSTNSFWDDNGITCELYAVWRDGAPYLCTKIITKEYVIDTPATVTMKTSKGEVITLTGTYAGENHTSTGGGVVIGSYVMTSISTTTGSMQLYPITQEQIEKLKDGIIKIRINTLPTFTEKTFNNGDMGAKLYQQFVEVKEKYDNF